VQSLCDRELRLLGRRHDAERAAECVGWARSAGLPAVSIDLMAGIPGQTAASFRRTIERAIELAPGHLSLYLLEIHAGSEMDVLRRERPGLFPGEEGQRRRYLLAAELLTAAGYRHYEISNFCRPGRECRHNLKYWRREDVLGLGPAAHSCRGSRRWHHAPDLERYLRDPAERLELPSEPEQERVFLGLRLADGVPVSALEAAGVPPRLLNARVRALGPFIAADGARLRLTREGFVLSTSVIAELLAPAE
jgi:oxygen-independent coproporphyrinogen-3 oxidase